MKIFKYGILVVIFGAWSQYSNAQPTCVPILDIYTGTQLDQVALNAYLRGDRAMACQYYQKEIQYHLQVRQRYIQCNDAGSAAMLEGLIAGIQDQMRTIRCGL